MGSTDYALTRIKQAGNHPHEYGEYIGLKNTGLRLKESPPCVWGVRNRPAKIVGKAGITPMCMGSTETSGGLPGDAGNHPHVYGEYRAGMPLLVPYSESPPCVWGVLSFCALATVCFGITPMCMGSTRSPRSELLASQNHPHVYGEYRITAKFIRRKTESPPCVWGVLKESH